jgi:YVTN family beta-propeller protein
MRCKNLFTLAALALAVNTCITLSALAGDTSYKVEQTWAIGGDGGWDYLTADPAAHLLYIARGNRVQVIDTQAGRLKGEITGFKGTHGVALNSDGKLGYISDGRSNSVAVFDRATLKVTATIAAGTNPDGIVFEPKTRRVIAFNGGSKNAAVIDTNTNQVVATIALPGKPEFPQSDGAGTVFVNIEDLNEIQRIDVASATITATWAIAPCDGPSGLAIDTSNKRLFSVCGNKQMAVVDYTTGKVVARPEIGNGPDAAGYDPKNAVAFSSNGEGTLTVIAQKSADSYDVVQTLATKTRARTLAVDAATGRIYLVSANFGPAPAPTPDNPRPRPPVLPDSFVVLVVGH